MSFKITRLLAWRYLQGTRQQRSLTTMVWVCALGIFIGTCALGLTTSIMDGFEKETHKKLQGIYPDISIQAPQNSSLNSEQLTQYLMHSYPHAIAGISDYGTHHILLHKKGVEEPTVVALLKTINPETESSVTPLANKLQSCTPLAQLLIDNHIVIGKEIAQALGVEAGDILTILYNQTPETPLRDAELSQATVVIAALLDTGIADYDTTLVITSHACMEQLSEKKHIDQIGIKLKPTLSEKDQNSVIAQLKALPDVQVSTWHDQYPAIVSALKLEKYAMALLLGLIALVASMNSISLLFMFITYKRTEIALLQSLGITQKYIMLIFLLFNLIITAVSAFFGLCTAYGIGTFLQHYPCITLPDAYYVTHLPVHMTFIKFVVIFCATLGLSILTALLPLASLSQLSITNTLRFE